MDPFPPSQAIIYRRAHRWQRQPPYAGRQTTIREIPSSTDRALANMRLKAGGVREVRWHKPAEWAFMLKGQARITAINWYPFAELTPIS